MVINIFMYSYIPYPRENNCPHVLSALEFKPAFLKHHILRKLLYRSPGKMLKIVNFNEQTPNLHCKNRKDTWATRQNRVKIGIRSTKIVENRQKVEKSQKKHHQGTRQNVLQM